jgi:nucleoside phosphorylase
VKARRVGAIVPQGAEFDFIRESLPFSGGEKVDGQQYHHFTIPGTGVTGVLRVLSDMGQAPATLAADRMISRLNVSLVVLIGTAAALDPDIQLGDVVVADQIQEYLRKARVIPEAGGEDFDFQRAAESWRINPRLLDHVNNWGWMADGEPAIAAWCQSAALRQPGAPGDPPGGPKVHIGPVATGDLVVAAQAFTNWIRTADRKLVALEMEAGGAALAAYHNDQADFLVVRGVSDYADDRKNALDAGQDAAGVKDAWRRYAVKNAIEYLTILLSSAGFPWREQPPAHPSAAAILGGVVAGATGASLLHDHHDDHPHDADLDSHHDQHHDKDGQHQPDGQHDPHHDGHQPTDLAAAAVDLAILSQGFFELEQQLEQQYADDHGDLGDLGDQHDVNDHYDFGDHGEHF